MTLGKLVGITAALVDDEPEVGAVEVAEMMLDSGTKTVAESVPVGFTVLVGGTEEVSLASLAGSDVVAFATGGSVLGGSVGMLVGGSVVVGRSEVVTGGGCVETVLFGLSKLSVGETVG